MKELNIKLSRRSAIKKVGLLTGATLLSPLAFGKRNKKKKNLRIAHITDVHIRPEHDALNRAKRSMKDIKKHKIDFLLNTGDTIYAADYDNITRERVTHQWAIWNEFRNTFSGYDLYSCLGNHDSWWAAPDKNDLMYGKKYVQKQLDMPGRYFSFDRNNWHFIVLDSIVQSDSMLDVEQQEWLENDVAGLQRGSNVIVMSHIPILAVSMVFNGSKSLDRKSLIELFYKHKDKNITCISGHTHTQDDCRYNGVNYFCNGALSGFWWEDGNEKSAQRYWVEKTPPGYAIIDLYEDGTVVSNYYSYK